MEHYGIKGWTFREAVMLQAFLLLADPSAARCGVLSEKYLDRRIGDSVEGQADCVLELYERLSADMNTRGLRHVYEEIDRPLTGVLARMERTGIRIEPKQLGVLSKRMDEEMQRLTTEIFAISGMPFNINSPQQLGKVLFEDLKLPSPVKYGKGKTTSTAADVLETLA